MMSESQHRCQPFSQSNMVETLAFVANKGATSKFDCLAPLFTAVSMAHPGSIMAFVDAT